MTQGEFVRAATVASVLAIGLTQTGCGSSPGEVVQPDLISGSEALGDVRCEPGIAYREPLVVDWSASQRTDLEVAMKDGVAVISYTCERLELLKRCSLPGSYAFTSVTPKQEVVQLVSRQELFANMPMTFVDLAGAVGSGNSIDLAMAMVGKRGTPRTQAFKTELEGECDGATHFVGAALVGAFAMDQGSAGEVQAAANIFGATAGAKSASSKQVTRRDGDMEACNEATATSDEPPVNCSAAIRLELVPLGEAPPATPLPPPDPEGPATVENPCSDGLVLSAGICREPSVEAPHLCADDDVDDCIAQCDAGHGPSCVRLGNQLTFSKSYGLSIAPDPAAGAE